MKTSILRYLVTFVAGAGCAMVVAQTVPFDFMSRDEYDKSATELLKGIEVLGAHTIEVKDGRTYMMEAPPVACFPPPVPKHEGAVDPNLLRRGLKALEEINTYRSYGSREVIFTTDKCKPAG
jgi:hypothetical protein